MFEYVSPVVVCENETLQALHDDLRGAKRGNQDDDRIHHGFGMLEVPPPPSSTLFSTVESEFRPVSWVASEIKHLSTVIWYWILREEELEWRGHRAGRARGGGSGGDNGQFRAKVYGVEVSRLGKTTVGSESTDLVLVIHNPPVPTASTCGTDISVLILR